MFYLTVTRSLILFGEGKKICAGLPALNTVAVEIVREFGFEQYSRSIRMGYGEKLNDCVNGVFATGGAMKG